MLCLIPMVNMAQEAQVSENDAVESAETVHREIGMRMMQYIDELHELAIVSDMHVTFMESSPLTMTYVNVLKEKVSILDERYNSIDVRWKTFMQAMQMDIADNEELMTTMSNVEQLKQILADSIAAKKQQCNALQDFVQAEELLAGQDTVFKSLDLSINTHLGGGQSRNAHLHLNEFHPTRFLCLGSYLSESTAGVRGSACPAETHATA